jgi:DnaJ-class molecular chaperone
MNYYEILGVNPTATNDEIKKAFRRMSFDKHPDRNPNCKDEYLKINEAYETLKDKEKRKSYDFNYMTLNTPNIIDYNDMGGLNNFFSEMLSSAIDKGVKKGKGKQINEFAAIFGMPGHDESVQFDPSIFMNPGMPFNSFEQTPDDIHIEQTISYQQSYQGCYIPIHIEREIVKGRMRKTESETIYINIEKGIDENEIMTIAEKGNVKDGISSDIKVKILLEKHREYSRRGIDLVLHKIVSFRESLCGFEFNLEHINGKSIKFTSSRGNIIQNGDEKVIDKLGFHRGEQVGNLVLSFHVVQPETLSEEQLKLIESIF